MKTALTVTTTRDFDLWWRDYGQFIPPADTATEAELEYLRAFASSSHRELTDAYYDKIREVEEEAEDAAEKEADKKLAEFKEEILEAIELADTDAGALEAVIKLVAK